MTFRRTAVQGYDTFRLTPDLQTRAKNETARHVRPGVEIGLESVSAEQLQPPALTRYLQIQYLQMTTRARTMARCLPSDYEWE